MTVAKVLLKSELGKSKLLVYFASRGLFTLSLNLFLDVVYIEMVAHTILFYKVQNNTILLRSTPFCFPNEIYALRI